MYLWKYFNLFWKVKKIYQHKETLNIYIYSIQQTNEQINGSYISKIFSRRGPDVNHAPAPVPQLRDIF